MDSYSLPKCKYCVTNNHKYLTSTSSSSFNYRDVKYYNSNCCIKNTNYRQCKLCYPSLYDKFISVPSLALYTTNNTNKTYNRYNKCGGCKYSCVYSCQCCKCRCMSSMSGCVCSMSSGCMSGCTCIQNKENIRNIGNQTLKKQQSITAQQIKQQHKQTQVSLKHIPTVASTTKLIKPTTSTIIKPQRNHPKINIKQVSSKKIVPIKQQQQSSYQYITQSQTESEQEQQQQQLQKSNNMMQSRTTKVIKTVNKQLKYDIKDIPGLEGIFGLEGFFKRT